ncbi:MAG: hypothetical protein WCD76_07400, partial [Pyrinomonadaceae bacterium]
IIVEGTRTPERDAHPIFVSFAAEGSFRLPVANVNEYRTLHKLARYLNLPVRIFASLHGREITGASREREEVYDFACQYVAYRAQDEGTRLGNENRLLREFGARLDGARNVGELQATINDIRRENFNRAAHPEQYAEERREDRRRGEQTRRPLSFGEMRSLLLAPAPEHYTDEMRTLRASRSVSVHDKARRLASLERGSTEPSPALRMILREFDRTQAPSPARTVRNIKSFLGDYLNPPSPERNRFSRENLYELRRQLDPTEQSYVFKLVNDTKQALALGAPVKANERSYTEAHRQGLNEPSRQHDQKTAQEAQAHPPYESLSFRLYYGASVWREAASLAAVGRRRVGTVEAPERGSQSFVPGVQVQDLETAAVLLGQYSKQPKMIEAADEYLRATGDDGHERIGEILATFREMTAAREPQGQTRYQITTPAGSALDREEWTRLLDEMPERIHAAQVMEMPEAERSETRRAALDLAWSDLQRVEQLSNLDHDQAAPERTDELRRAIERGGELQLRARTASDVLERSFAAQSEQVNRTLQAKGLPLADSQSLRTLTRIALDSQYARDYEQQLHNETGASGVSEPTITRAQVDAIRSVVTPSEQRQHQEFAAYAARAKGDYLESFGQIDEQIYATHNMRQERDARSTERSEHFGLIRGRLETTVAAHLTGVVQEGGAEALEAGRVQHTDAVSRIIKQTFQQAGYDLQAFNLNDERLNTVTAGLVQELPASLRTSRERTETHGREQELDEFARRDSLLVKHTAHSAVHNHSAPIAVKLHHSTLQQEAADAHHHEMDDEFVEQRVSHSIGQIHEQALVGVSSSRGAESRQSLNRTAAHELTADNREQFTRGHILTR